MQMKTSTKNALITSTATLIAAFIGFIGGEKLNINQTIIINEKGKTIEVNSDDYIDLMNENHELQVQNNNLQKQNEDITKEKDNLQKQYEKLLQETSPSEDASNQPNDNDDGSAKKTKTKAISDSNYLLDLVQPYESPYWFTEYNGKTFDMGGDSYTHGFTCMGYGNDSDGNITYFNLHGKYSKISFIAGVVHRAGIFGDSDDDCTITIYADDTVADTITINPNNLPSEHEVNINNCNQLKICVSDGRYVADGSGTYGLSELKAFE